MFRSLYDNNDELTSDQTLKEEFFGSEMFLDRQQYIRLNAREHVRAWLAEVLLLWLDCWQMFGRLVNHTLIMSFFLLGMISPRLFIVFCSAMFKGETIAPGIVLSLTEEKEDSNCKQQILWWDLNKSLDVYPLLCGSQKWETPEDLTFDLYSKAGWGDSWSLTWSLKIDLSKVDGGQKHFPMCG